MRKLLFLHGALGAKEQFKRIIDELYDFECFSFNFSGHGGNPFEVDFSIEQFSKELKDYIKNNNLEGIDIFGYSMGGYVAMNLARTEPDLINSIFTLGTMLDFGKERINNEIKMMNPDIIEQKVPKFAEVLRERHQPNDWKILLKRTSEMMINLSEKAPILESDFRSTDKRILFGIGDRDTTASLSATSEIFGLVKNSGLLVIPNTYHPIEKVDLNRILFEIRSFVK